MISGMMKLLQGLGCLLLFLSWISCDNNSQENVEFMIISPFDCSYTFLIEDQALSVSSTMSDTSKVHTLTGSDRLVRTIDTLISDSDWNSLKAEIEILRDAESNIDHRTQGDAYAFECIIDGDMRRRSIGYDREIFKALQILRPYINSKKIQCCYFFQMFDSINDIK